MFTAREGMEGNSQSDELSQLKEPGRLATGEEPGRLATGEELPRVEPLRRVRQVSQESEEGPPCKVGPLGRAVAGEEQDTSADTSRDMLADEAGGTEDNSSHSPMYEESWSREAQLSSTEVESAATLRPPLATGLGAARSNQLAATRLAARWQADRRLRRVDCASLAAAGPGLYRLLAACTEVRSVDSEVSNGFQFLVSVEDESGGRLELEAGGAAAEQLLGCSVRQCLADEAVKEAVEGSVARLAGKLMDLAVSKSELGYNIVMSKMV
jgi:hypothetical protein